MITVKISSKTEMDKKRKDITSKAKIIKKKKLTIEREYNWLKEKGIEDIKPLDYDSESKKIIRENLIPLYNDYTENYGTLFISKNFVEQCKNFCENIDGRMKIVHANKCSQFLRLLTLFQIESSEYKKLKKKFYINCYPLINVGDISVKLQELNHIWEQKKKIF